jgi:hypothetical protein
MGVSNHRSIAAWLAETAATRYWRRMTFASRTVLVRRGKTRIPAYEQGKLQPLPLPPLSFLEGQDVQKMPVIIGLQTRHPRPTNDLRRTSPAVRLRASITREAGFHLALANGSGPSVSNSSKQTVVLFDCGESHALPSAPVFRHWLQNHTEPQPPGIAVQIPRRKLPRWR